MKQKTRGLVIGKFAPLHKGHEFLINRAVREMDKVVVLLYHAPSFPISLSRRTSWIKELWPRVRVVQGRRTPGHGKGPRVRRLHEQYISRVCGRLGITHVYSSEAYGTRAAEILGAKHVMVDKERSHIPISGVQIRKSPGRLRSYLSPHVARDLHRAGLME